jgi:hypothetical protein
LGLIGTALVIRTTGNIRYAFFVCVGITGLTIALLLPYFLLQRFKRPNAIIKRNSESGIVGSDFIEDEDE